MKDENLFAFATIEELASLFAKRKLSPVEVTAQFLNRIERVNPRLNAYLTVIPEAAMAAARRAEKEWARDRKSAAQRPLLGIPIALKDNIWTRGIRTTAGSSVLRDFIPSEDATVARKLARAGAVLLGKTNMHEFAYGATSANVHFGPTRNPWAMDRIPGGSSGGSAAAVAAGLCTAAAGTDTGGSVRIPAALCGIVGLKPTFGRVSVHGTIPLAPTFDHVGPLARSVSDAAIMLDAMAGRDPLDPTSSQHRVEDYSTAIHKPLRKFRLGRPQQYFWDTLDSEVRRIADAALNDLEKHGAMLRLISLPQVRDSMEPATQIAVAEARRVHEAAGYFPAHAAEYGEEVRRRIESGANIRAIDYIAAFDARKRVRAEFDAALMEVDAIVAPTVPVPALPIGAEHVQIDGEMVTERAALLGLNRPANFTGLPSISVPCGFTRDGLPVGLQFIGRAFDEATLLRIAFAYERIHSWNERHPKL